MSRTTAPPPPREARPTADRRHRNPTDVRRAGWSTRVVLLVLCALWMLPALGLLVTSFRPVDDITTTGWWTALGDVFDPTAWTTQNYVDVIVAQGMGNAFLNSLTVTVPATAVPILAAAFAAYAFAWMRFPGRNFLFIVVVALLVVPIFVAFVPIFRLFNTLGIQGDFLSVWLAHTGFGMPLAVYILRNYMAGLPRELIESAKVDGASHFQIFWRLIIPLSFPALAAFSILQFLWVWNDLLVALVFLGSAADVEVVTVRLQGLLGSRGQDWHLLTSGAFVTMIVPLIVFFSLQRYFIRGLTAGSLKG
ncbi:carbohydrate ABC transporter permease [Egibacter rhizosphaerae]|uniref:Carbohydrate ABC transporter permease n=1 Tax=Egibacter rhizosphaerae TaxID=1670831 RepID=A0A411YAA4_9ACTN|nr:carbohydrate ABC transporter permease [Egibacter rhizosphaerae]QBI18112.1 carbohydrate ABC transporter permease [Egibacter rhizosphaerae]